MSYGVFVVPHYRRVGYAAKYVRQRSAEGPACIGLAMTPCGRHTTIGASLPEWTKDSELPPGTGVKDDGAIRGDDRLPTHALGPLETIGVRGAVRGLEKRILDARFALMPE